MEGDIAGRDAGGLTVRVALSQQGGERRFLRGDIVVESFNDALEDVRLAGGVERARF